MSPKAAASVTVPTRAPTPLGMLVKDFGPWELLTTTSCPASTATFTRGRETASVPAKGRLEVNDSSAMVAAALDGFGVVRDPRMCWSPRSRQGRSSRCCGIGRSQPGRRISCARPTGERRKGGDRREDPSRRGVTDRRRTSGHPRAQPMCRAGCPTLAGKQTSFAGDTRADMMGLGPPIACRTGTVVRADVRPSSSSHVRDDHSRSTPF